MPNEVDLKREEAFRRYWLANKHLSFQAALAGFNATYKG